MLILDSNQKPTVTAAKSFAVVSPSRQEQDYTSLQDSKVTRKKVYPARLSVVNAVSGVFSERGKEDKIDGAEVEARAMFEILLAFLAAATLKD